MTTAKKTPLNPSHTRKMKTKPSYIGMAIGASLFVWGIFGLQKRFTGASLSAVTTSEPLVERDWAIVKSDKPEKSLYIESLRRLAVNQSKMTNEEPELLELVRRELKSKEIRNRQVALESLGAFKNSTELFIECGSVFRNNQSPPSDVSGCLAGLSLRSSQDRFDFLNEWLKSQRPETQPHFWSGMDAQWQVSPTFDEKQRVIARALSLFNHLSPSMNRMSPFLFLLRRAPQHPEVNRFVQKFSAEEPFGALQKVALFHLIQSRDPSLQVHWPLWLEKSSDARVDFLIKQTSSICHKDRLQILKTFLSKPDRQKFLSEVLNAFVELREPGGILLLEALLTQPFWVENQRKQILDTIEIIKAPQSEGRGPRPCE